MQPGGTMMRRSITIVLFALTACGAGADSTSSSAVTLPTDPVQRALACTAAAVSEVQALPGRSDGRLPSAQHQEWTYYSLLAAKARHCDAMTYDHVVDAGEETMRRRGSEPGFGDTRRSETLAACRTAYPAAAGLAAVTLPADADEAVLQCVGIARVWPGLTRDQVTDFEERLAQAQRVSQAVMPEIERIAAARNLATEQELVRMSDQALARAVGLGRPDRVIDACERRFARPA